LQPTPFNGIYHLEMHIIASLLNLGGPDLIFILLVVLVLFGPKKLPELARGLRQAMNEFNKAKDDVERELTRSDVTVQPAPGQMPRQPAELPPAPPPIAVNPTAQVMRPVDERLFDAGNTFQRPSAPVQMAGPVEDTHPAGQA
jgi:sec-independent protein translocase protein TatA